MPWGWRLLCLWPGLARLWLRGDFQALGFAVFFSVLLNLALVSSLIWPAYLGSRFLLVAWPLLAAVWLVNAWISWRWLPNWLQVGHKFAAAPELRVDTLFNQAQREYLRCRWAEAQGLLERRLRLRPRDVESRLLLTSVLRRVGRFQQAVKELDLLEGMDEALPWSQELTRERERLHAARQTQQAPQANLSAEAEGVQQLPVVDAPILQSIDATLAVGGLGSEQERAGHEPVAISAQELRAQMDQAFALPDQTSVETGTGLGKDGLGKDSVAVAAVVSDFEPTKPDQRAAMGTGSRRRVA